MTKNRRMHWLIAGLVILIVLVFLKNAWVSEDAFISFRSITQYWEGNGPRWNPHERVQVYTSPLWFWTCVLTRPLFPDVFIQILVLSITCLGLFLWVGFRHFGLNGTGAAAVFSLLLSRSFFDYTTSGLENMMAVLLLAVFSHNALAAARETDSRRSVDTALLFAGLSLVCRHDLILLTGPAAVHLLIHSRRPASCKTMVRRLVLLCLPGI
ncbi:MAG TPA: glycosyltransferase family 39 protein, partial [bacterium]|nr:glycosyltransferase family 39 protein [bacterium]